MFDKEFYPTPPKLIRKMLEPYFIKESHYLTPKLTEATILEPSAGKGDIINFINEHTRRELDVYAIEKNQDLQSILHDNNIPVIADDFLNFETDLFFDFIIMNPPFSNGADHLLKAWEILQDGSIICLLNAETILNPYTKKRKLLLNIIKENGNYEIIENSFLDAERTTEVKIALIRLKKVNTAFSDMLNFDGLNQSFDDFEFKDDFSNTDIAINDVFTTYVSQYNNTKTYFKEFLKAYHNLNNVLGVFTGNNSYNSLDFCKIAKENNPKKAYHKFDSSLKKIGWNSIFKKTNMVNNVSTTVVRNFHTFQRQRSNLSFDKKNIIALLDMLYTNKNVLIEESLREVWELLCSFDKKNSSHWEGWKTNDAFRINTKVIIPNLVKYGSYCDAYHLKKYGDRFSINKTSEMHDIDLVLCHLSGKKITEIKTIEKALKNHFTTLGSVRTGDNFENNLESEFFKIRFYKKGTTHFIFKDKYLLQELNIRYAKGKNWLPNDYQAKEKREKQKAKKTRNKPPKNKKQKSMLVNDIFNLFSEAV